MKVICDNCGIEFKRQQSHLKNSRSGLRFCTRKCKDIAQRANNKGNLLRPNYCKGGKYAYRQIAFREFEQKCNRCSYNEYIGILKVHHKDRNRMNNQLSNLEILCPNCHDLEHLLNKVKKVGL